MNEETTSLASLIYLSPGFESLEASGGVQAFLKALETDPKYSDFMRRFDRSKIDWESLRANFAALEMKE